MLAKLGLAAALAAVAAAQTAPELWRQKLLDDIAAIDRRLDGVLGVAVIDLTTQQTLEYHAATVFPTASTIKVAILAEAHRAARAGAFRFAAAVRLAPADRAGGSGVLDKQLESGPVETTFSDLAEKMIVVSDNTATNALIRALGRERINQTLAEMGFREMRLRREMVALLQRVNGALRKAIPAAVPVAAKPGDMPGVRGETGLVLLPGRPYAISIMATYLGKDVDPVAEAARAVHRTLERLAHGNRYGHQVR